MKNDQVVEKGVLALHRHFYNQFLIIFHFNHPNSNIKSQREFRLELVKQLVQPLLNLKASPECPSVLQSHKGRSVISPDKWLTGKRFSYKAIERGRCCVCSKCRSSRGKRVDKKTKNYYLKCEVYLCLGECCEWFRTKSPSTLVLSVSRVNS